MMTLVTAQDMRECLGDVPVRGKTLSQWADVAIGEILRFFVKPDLRAVLEMVGPAGEVYDDHFDGRLLNPGHAIEAAWFILEEANHRQDESLKKLGCDMLDWMWARGWDHEFGGLFYFRDVFDKPVQEYWHDMKFWWPHDEALIATLMAHRMTGEPRYLEWHEQCRKWSFGKFADPEHGEWFGYLRRDGTPTNTLKGSLWKSFFHHPRSLWRCHQLAKD
jgi:N-acylglucosamine 2-epimerase